MKSKRSPLIINDFSGGLQTTPPQTDVDMNPNAPQHTPDCLNVYAEGRALRKRFGITHINSASAGTTGNGIYNWVLNASQQYLMGFFDANLKQMSVSGTSWSGTWNAISADSASGTAFSNALMNFVTYQGTLIMATENRDKPQRMTVTDTSYKNLDYNVSGSVAPFGKYLQVWKEHVWLLNIGAGGQLSEDCVSLSGWTNQDVGTGLTSQTSLGGLTTFRFHGGTNNGDNSQIKRTVTSMTTAYSAEIKTYFSTLGAVTSGDYAWLDIYNGTIRFRTRWSTDGVETFNGTTWLKVGVGLVTTGTWIVWKYLITAGTASAAVVDVYQNGSAVGLQFSVANATTASNGQIQITGNAGGSANRCDWYMDYLYILSITPRTNYYTDGVFNTWVGTTQATFTDNVRPTVPFMQYKCNDNAASTTATNNGASGNNGVANSSTGTVNTSTIASTGKINNCFSLNSAIGNYISISPTDVTTIKNDTTGSITAWINPISLDQGMLFSMNASTAGDVHLQIDSTITFQVGSPNGTAVLSANAGTITSNNWQMIGLVQNGTAGVNFYLNNILLNTTYVTSTNKAAWFNLIGNLHTSGLIGCRRAGGNLTGFQNCRVDDFRYYRTSLTSFDIASIYAEGNGTEGQPVTVQEGTTIYTGTYSYRINNDGQYALINQTLVSGTAITGVSNILGLWINATNNSTYKIRINDTTINYDSPIFTANGTWQYQTLNFTPTSSSPSVFAQVISLSSSTLFIDQVAITQSSTGTTQDFSDRLSRSLSGTYDTWTDGANGSSDDSGHNDITTPGDVGLTGSFILQDRMYVMKAWNIYRITYTGSIPLLDIKQARSVSGTKSPRAICNIDYPNYGEIVIFLGTDRNLYLFDGFASTPLTDDVQLNNGMAQVYFNNINTQALDKIFAVNHSNLGCYEIFLPMGNSTVPNFSMFYNYKTKAFWPFDNRNFLSGRVSDDGSGQRVVMVVGATNGILYEINTDTTSSDDGASINAYWNSFKLGEDYVLGKQDQIQIATDSVTATPTFKWRSNYETSYVSQTLIANQNQYVFDPARESNLIQFQIGDNSTNNIWKLWHVKVLERGIGIGG